MVNSRADPGAQWFLLSMKLEAAGGSGHGVHKHSVNMDSEMAPAGSIASSLAPEDSEGSSTIPDGTERVS